MDLKLINFAIASYKEVLNEEDAARLDFFRGLWEVQDRQSALRTRALETALVAEKTRGKEALESSSQEALRAFKQEAVSAPDQETMLSWYWGEKPFFLMAPLAVDKESLIASLEDCSSYLIDHAELKEASSQALRSFNWRSLIEVSDISKAGYDPVSYLDECSTLADGQEENSLSYDFALLVLSFALRPLLQVEAERLMEVISSRLPEENTSHHKPMRCPVCGGTASASFVGETPSSRGKGRLLYCATCGTHWEFERIRCAHCGTQNQGHLHYYHLEGDSAHRLYTCDVCGDYLRTVFQEELQTPFSFEVEDVIMTKLDMVAHDSRFSTKASQQANLFPSNDMIDKS